MSRDLTKRFGVLAVVGLLGLQMAGMTTSPTASAASLTVDGSCTLADAIVATNTDTAVGGCAAGSGADTVVLGVDVFLTEPLPKVEDSELTIEGAGHVVARADIAPDFRLFEVQYSVLRLDDIILANGASPGEGGAISAEFAVVSITDSIIRENSARIGGAISLLDAGLTLTRSTITGNAAAAEGGGIEARSTGSGSGGITIIDSTLTANTALSGGAINAGGKIQVTLTNSTISGNGLSPEIGGTRGGGLALYDVRSTIRHTTIAGNTAQTGGGVWVPEPDTTGDPNYEVPRRPTMIGVILDNPVGGDCGALSLPLDSGGHNLIAGLDDCGLDEPTDLVGANSDLGSLDDNGGPTETRALGAASDAVDAIAAADCTVSTDQRGIARPAGGGCDIGAFEAADAVAGPVDWMQVGDDIDGEARLDWSGWSVAMSSDGNTVIIGALNNGIDNNSGHARVYRLANGAWVQVGGDIDGEGTADQSGQAVAMSNDGNTVVVTAGGNNGNGKDSGHARVFRFDGEMWVQVGGDIDGEVAGDRSGQSVAMSGDGNTVVIGTLWNDGNGELSGQVRVFHLVGGVWEQVGDDIDGEAAGDWAGRVATSEDGHTIIVGAVLNDGNGNESGHARVFRLDGGVWTQVGADIDGEAAGDQSGQSVAMSSDGNTVVIGATGNDGNGGNSGHARVYRFDGVAWVQVGGDIDGETAGDRSGFSVAMSGDGAAVIIGTIWNDGNGEGSGHGRVFRFDGDAWIQVGGDVDGEAAGDASGRSVAMSDDGNTIIIGAALNGGNGRQSGHARVFRLGAAPILACGDMVGAAVELESAGYNVIVGTDSADFLLGTDGDDFVLGRGGNDVILAGMGDDVVCAGDAHDVVVGGNGSDQVHGEGGNDKVWGGNDDDLITGGTGKDLLVGGDGADKVFGGGADDLIRGGNDDDVLHGGNGRDDVRGDAGNDTLFGDVADDVLRGHGGVDVCDGGASVNGDRAYSCETLIDVP